MINSDTAIPEEATREQRQRLRERDYCKTVADGLDGTRWKIEAVTRCIYELADYEEGDTMSVLLFKGMRHVEKARVELELAIDCFKQRAEEIDAEQ